MEFETNKEWIESNNNKIDSIKELAKKLPDPIITPIEYKEAENLINSILGEEE